MPEHPLILGLGSNLGDRLNHLQRAVRELDIPGRLRVLAVSPVYESAAMLLPDAPPEWQLPFFNIAVSVDTSLDPHAVLKHVKAIETRVGRQNRGRWSPREIDIDLLAWGDRTLNEGGLTLPHPGLRERPFALWPLEDLTPLWRFPSDNAQVGDVARSLEKAGAFGTRKAKRAWTRLFGILNVTPDSFSDGGEAFSAEQAAAKCVRLAADGADVVDLGAESTRPGARALTSEEEWTRLRPAFDLLAQRRGALGRAELSLDTRHPDTFARALELCAKHALPLRWLNDVSGLGDARMQRLARESECQVVVMHSLTVPASREVHLPRNADPVAELLKWRDSRLPELEAAGIARHRIAFDPGLGFGKTAEQSMELLRRLAELRPLGTALFVGHSRKSFLRAKPEELDERTHEAGLVAAFAGAEYLRVHDVLGARRRIDDWHRGDGVLEWSPA